MEAMKSNALALPKVDFASFVWLFVNLRLTKEAEDAK
jgi:hypothetical protein